MRRRLRFCLVSVSTFACVVGVTAPSVAAQGGRGTNPIRGAAAREQAAHALERDASRVSPDFAGGSDDDAMDEAEQYANERSLPAESVSGQALVAAHRTAARLPHTARQWTEVTTKPYNAAPSAYRDPIWSNFGSGFGVVAGRTTALAAQGKYWYAGAADGGVWRSTNQGKKWTPIFDSKPTLSIGALAIDPSDGSLWVGTGEANTSTDEYDGTGVYVSHNHGKTFQRVGGKSLTSALTFKIAFDGVGGVYAATSTGLYKTSASHPGTWKLVLQPDAGQNDPPYNNQITTVVVRPGTHGHTVLAVTGWRNGSEYNGFYLSNNSGATFRKISPSGDINDPDIGRTTLAYSTDGSKLYALVESPAELLDDAASNLMGVYVSANGSPSGPYRLIADKTKLENSGSALTPTNSPGYEVGIQSWYNEVLTVDPRNANHLYVGLEEGFESSNGGKTFTTASPYWNYGLACGNTCPPTTHPDQHAAMFVNGKIVIGNDGGVYSRPAADTGYGHWTDLNATYHDLQYYDAQSGAMPHGGIGYWGGLQDNGTGLISSGLRQQVEPAGGDGGDVIVDPGNAQRMVGEYTDQALYLTTDGGKHFRSMAPSCYGQEIVGDEPRANCDPESAFIAPMTTNVHNIGDWVTGGQYVWTSTAGWGTVCDPSACSWRPRYNLGSGRYATALAESGNTLYATWVGGNGEPGPDFARGVATNAGGSWHQLNMAGLPNRFPAGITVDPTDVSRVYLVFNGYSRRWIPGGGTGVVFESDDSGRHWTNITGDLPDAPGDALVVSGHTLALATDVGVFTATVGAAHERWTRLGTNLPGASVNDVRLSGNTLVAATHGRGIWTYTLP
jgi:hypothetical protein